MRAVVGLASTLVVMLISLWIYKVYFTSTQAVTGSVSPTVMIDTIGVKNDLISIAQAERIYQAQHDTYGSIDDLVSSGAMAYKKTGREGYTYDAEASTDSFRISARCTEPQMLGCMPYSVDQTLQLTTP
jgi:hypothetical protein